MIRKPYKVLVCLALISTFVLAQGYCYSYAYSGGGVAAATGVEADALSADTKSRGVQPAPRPSYKQPAISGSSGSRPTSTVQYPKTGERSSSTYGQSHSSSGGSHSGRPPVHYGSPQYENPNVLQYGSPGVSAPAACPPATPCASPGLLPEYVTMSGFQPLAALGFRGTNCQSFLPRTMCRQFSLSARLWHAKWNSSTFLWGTNTLFGPGTDLDPHRDLQLEKHKYIPEYELRYQIRQNWAIKYSFMPMQFQGTAQVPTPGGFFFGNLYYPQYAPMRSEWTRLINRWDLDYDWFNERHAVSTIFAGFALYDDKLQVNLGPMWTRTRSRTLHLAYAGMTLEKVVRTVGGGAYASLHCKWSTQFLEGYVGWDGMITSRVSVPMDCGRFGYIEMGWRWITLRYDRPTDVDKINLDGMIGSAGLIF